MLPTPAPASSVEKPSSAALTGMYGQLCESYRSIDSFRVQLLGAVPLVTGAGIVFLAKEKADLLEQYRMAVGLFGALITLGLFFLEIYGIRKCTALIKTGRYLESRIAISEPGILGQFLTRPDPVAGFINEPFAAGLIYPVAIAAWIFLALKSYPRSAGIVCVTVFVAGVAGSVLHNRALRKWHPPNLPRPCDGESST